MAFVKDANGISFKNRLKDIQNMLAKDFNIHYQNINGVHYLLTKLGDYYTLFIVLLFFEFCMISTCMYSATCL
jgi:hypothetical protein